jgi:anti-sigma B factor antagonist
VTPHFQSRKIDPDVIVAEISGRLNLGNTLQSIEAQLLALIKNGSRKLIVDLSALTYVDSAGIGMLIGCNGQMEQAGGRFRITGIQGGVAKSFEIVHVDRIVTVLETVEAALAQIEQ